MPNQPNAISPTPETSGGEDDNRWNNVGYLRAEILRLSRIIGEYQEREAACCPEDVGFDEYIRTLESRLSPPSSPGEALSGAVNVALVRETLDQIKAAVVGERNPRWTTEYATTHTRRRVADWCDYALCHLPPDAAMSTPTPSSPNTPEDSL